MQTITQQMESYEAMTHNLMIMKENAIRSMQMESEAIEGMISNVFIKISGLYKGIRGKGTEADSKEIESYERIIQDLVSLKEAAMETKMNEAKIIEASLLQIARYCDCNAVPIAGDFSVDDMETIFGPFPGEIVFYAN